MTDSCVVFLKSPHAVPSFKAWQDDAEAVDVETYAFTLDETLWSAQAAVLKRAQLVFIWLPLGQHDKVRFLSQLGVALSLQTVVVAMAHDCMTADLAAWYSHEGQLVGCSPMGLLDGRKAVTLSQPLNGSQVAQDAVTAFFTAQGRTPYWIQDTPGMVVPRIVAMLANEAAFAVQEGVATVPDIDTAMKLGTNYPLGPLAWADRLGLADTLAILDHLWQMTHDSRYRACILFRRLVRAGFTGQAAGRGFYAYTPTGTATGAALLRMPV